MWFAQIYIGIILKTFQRANMISPDFFKIIRNYFARCLQTYNFFAQIYDLLISRNFTILIHTNLGFSFRAISFAQIWNLFASVLDNLLYQFTLLLFRAILRFLSRKFDFFQTN